MTNQVPNNEVKAMCEELMNNLTDTTFMESFDKNISCPEATEEEMMTLTLLSFLLEGVAQFTISSLGILGNSASIFLLTRKALSNFFNRLLVVLAVYDLIYCLTMMLESLTKLGILSDIHTILFPHVL